MTIAKTSRSRPTSDDDDISRKAYIPTTGDAEIVQESLGSVTGSDRSDYNAMLAFNEQEIKIIVWPQSANESDTTRLIAVGVQGRKQYIMAGREQWLKRKYVERLVRARPDMVKASGSIDGRTQKERNVMDIVSRTAYTFEVLEDPEPQKGRQWLADLKAQQRVQIR